ncbi:hypothetical protein ACFQ34_09125 [Pseudonocardia benzenivorans]|uniref:RAMA domain-containing protein n=2 Tax=Pseudonocardiaceae TaxID=2070 RepID=A0ABW3VFA3_9PSEU|nr:hypothetical protein PSD17_27440 [Pseudonocardia sp. D17]
MLYTDPQDNATYLVVRDRRPRDAPRRRRRRVEGPSRRGIERHHLFPKAFLKRTGIGETKRVNQIANMALVEWSDNIDISDQPPTEYWPAQIAQRGISPQRLAQQCYWHALPPGWESLRYEEFLEARRGLMSTVVRDAFTTLGDQTYDPTYPAPGPVLDPVLPGGRTVTLADLVRADLLPEGTVLSAAGDSEITATVLAGGQIRVGGQTYDSPSAAATNASGGSRNGWTYWIADLADGQFSLASLRETSLNSAEPQR